MSSIKCVKVEFDTRFVCKYGTLITSNRSSLFFLLSEHGNPVSLTKCFQATKGEDGPKNFKPQDTFIFLNDL